LNEGFLRRLPRRLRRLLSPRRHLEVWRWIGGQWSSIRRRRRERLLTVGVDINALYEPLTGVGWYLHQILAHLAQRDDLRLRLYGQALVDDPDRGPLTPPPSGPAIEWVRFDPLAAPFLFHGLVSRLLRKLSPWLVRCDQNRVLMAPNYLLPPLFRRSAGRRVAMVHDLAVRKLPHAVRPDTRVALERNLTRALEEATSIIVPSEAVKADLVALAGVPPERVHAIHHGLGSTGAVAEPVLPHGVRAPFGLHVGTIEPRKNLVVLLAAWRELISLHPDALLVLAGGMGWHDDAIAPELERGEREGWLRRLGYVPPPQLAGLYGAATLVAAPSLDEGFGLPVVEALAAGRPLVLSDIAVFHEIAGNAARYVPAGDPRAWCETLAELWSDADRRAEMSRLARLRAAEFDWSRAAQETASVLRAAAER
jgi:alpha-1,3-rhamnosyl/mannosyltransferase